MNLQILEERLSHKLDAGLQKANAPHLIRICSLPVLGEREPLAGSLMHIHNEMVGVSSRMDEAVEQAVALLHRKVGTTSDVDLRRSLLRIKRQIFGHRSVSEGDYGIVSQMEQELADSLHAYRQVHGNISDLEVQLYDCWNSLYEQSLRDALGTASNQNLLITLAYANQSLYTELNRARSSRSDRQKPQVARSLERYRTRMMYKPSPFGTLCSIALVEPVAHNTAFTECRAIANKALLPYLQRALVAGQTSQLWPVVLNTSLRVSATTLSWIASQGAAERFCSAERSVSLDVLVSLVAGPAAPFAHIVDIIAEVFTLSRDEAQSQVYRFLEQGLLLWFPFSSDQDTEWPSRLRAFLSVDDSEAAKTAVELLDAVMSTEKMLTGSVGCIDAAAVAAKIDRARALADSLGMKGSCPRFTQPIVHVDSRRSVETTEIPSPPAHLWKHLDSLLATLALISPDRLERAALTRVFELAFADRHEVPLLDFYRQAFEAHFRAAYATPSSFGRVDSDRRLLYGDAAIVVLRQARDTFQKRLAQWLIDRSGRGTFATTVSFGYQELAQFIGHLDRPSFSIPLTVFYHLTDARDTGEAPLLVVPNAGAAQGFGKYFSRFLHLYRRPEYPDLDCYLSRLEDAGAREIRLDSQFNANLHVPMYRRGIAYPCNEPPVGSADVTLEQLVVRKGQDGDACLFVGGSDEQVLPVDLGFLSDFGRPGLFRMLKRFQPSARTHIEVLEWMVKELEHSRAPEIVEIPRVVFAGAVVIQRSCWLIPLSGPGRPAVDHFSHAFELGRWWLRMRLPERCFARVVGRSSSERPSGASLRADDRKPQFISLSSPLLMELAFELLRANRDGYLVLEECLPWKSDTVAIDNELFRVEHVTERTIRATDAVILG